MSDDALAGLDDVKWAELEHAYGAATDTPALLRRMAKGHIDDETWEAIGTSITHQTTVYSASAAAAPFLIAMTHTLRGEDLCGVLDILDPIAAGNADDEAARAACIAAARRGYDRFIELLEHDDHEARPFAARLLIRFADRIDDARARIEAAIDAEDDPKARAALLGSYDRIALPTPSTFSRLRALVDHDDGAVAARAAFTLLGLATEAPERVVADAIVRELALPAHRFRILPPHDVLARAAAVTRPVLLDAICEGATRATTRTLAFDLGHAALWLAFHRRLGGAARKPRRFFFAASVDFPMPWDMGGGPTKGSEWTCTPYVRRWDFPRPDYWSEPPKSGALVGVNIAEQVDAASLSPDEKRVLDLIVSWDAFWRTDSDLPAVYGLPVKRLDLERFIGKRRSFWKW